MIPSSFLRSTSFRLAALYAVVFGVSVGVLMLSVYWSALAEIDAQIDESVHREADVLVDVLENRGVISALRAIQRRTGALDSPRRYYLLQDENANRLGGNLPPMTPVEGRIVMQPPASEGDRDARWSYPIVAVGRRLATGEFLLVGESRYRAAKTQEAILRALGWGVAITVLLAFAGGALVALGFLRRIEDVNRTSRAIIEGNLSNRIPTYGTGDEMDRLAVNLNAMLDRIQILMESVKRVSDDIAHDLRTPLSRLRQKLELARERAQTREDYVANMDVSIAEVDAILDTFAALLRIAQIESRARREAFADLSLGSIVAAVAETFAPVAEDSGHTLHARIDAPAMIHGDRGLLTQLVANLVENSIRHCPPGASITLSLGVEGGEALLRVADTGPGIPEAEYDKVFRRFYRVEASRTTPGSGLGLALVKAVADLHDATIELTDHHPGLVVTVRFACANPAAERRGAVPAPVPADSVERSARDAGAVTGAGPTRS